tara:strand:+ start:1342 stop:1836 length:495 start_codon:yes stop_codon:yes gene_type:complete
MLDLQVKDNFFTEDEYNLLVNNLTKIDFKPSSNDIDGHFSFHHAFEPTSENQWIFDKIKDSFYDQNLGIYKCRFDMRHNKNQTLPHLDSDRNDYNCIIYLRGDELLYNGTGFYHNNSLHSYVGFVKNRALFFNGAEVYHTDLQSLGQSSMRYSLNIFYERLKDN